MIMILKIKKMNVHIILAFICGTPLIAACSPSLSEQQATVAIEQAIRAKNGNEFSFVTNEAKGFPGGTVEAYCQVNESGNAIPGTCKFSPVPNFILQELHKLGYVTVSDKPVAKQSQGGPSYYKTMFTEDLLRIYKGLKKGRYSDRLIEQVEYNFNSGDFGNVSIIDRTKPAELMGQRITRVSFTVPYQYNTIAAKVLKMSNKNYKGQATFILNESGWKLSEYAME
jgi:hypothetical protein